MRAAVRIVLFVVGMAAVFIGAAAVSDAVVPESVVDDWERSAVNHEEPGGATDTEHEDTDEGAEHPAPGESESHGND